MNFHEITRRQLLKYTSALATTTLAPVAALADGVSVFHLSPEKSSAGLLGKPYPDVPVWAFNGQIPGPEIRVQQGDQIQVQVINRLEEETTVHWHGIRLPNNMDGVPGLTQDPIAPGGTHTYKFDAIDAGTFWYHPHSNSAEQIGRGLHGALIVEEKNKPAFDHDLTWVLDDWRIAEDATIYEPFYTGMDISHSGRIGNVITINGRIFEEMAVRSGERFRIRLINVANARIFGLKFEGHSPKIIAVDGQPTNPHDPEHGEIILGPGMRIDLAVDFGHDPLKSFAIRDEYYSNSSYELGKIRYRADLPVRTSPLNSSMSLSDNQIPVPNLNSARKFKVTIEGGAMGGMRSATYKGEKLAIQTLFQQGKVWALNGIAAHDVKMDPIVDLKRGETGVMTIENKTGWPHPMHLHGFSFQIISRNGKASKEKILADTVLLEREETVEVAFVADNPGDWLFHCHILEHTAGGMSGIIRVT